MLDRLLLGKVAEKPHIIFKDPQGKLLHEECFTRQGFDGAYTIMYHRNPPMEDVTFGPTTRGWPRGEKLPASASRKLFLGPSLKLSGAPLDARRVILMNEDLHVALCKPTVDDEAFLANNDGDDLYYIFTGGALLETPLGSLDVAEGDYVWVPRSLPYRFRKVGKDALWMHVE